MTIDRRRLLSSVVATGTLTLTGCLGRIRSGDTESEQSGETLIAETIEDTTEWDIELSEEETLHVQIESGDSSDVVYERETPDERLYEATVPETEVTDSWEIAETGDHTITVDTSAETAVEFTVES